MTIVDYQHIHFLKSAAQLSQCPADVGKEVAFAGRSNAGKSSAINRITSKNKLARTSKTPGRTQLLNFFQVDEPTYTEDPTRLVDLPGYGYAKVPEAIRLQWHGLLTHYFTERRSLHGILLFMDIRHPLKAFDRQMIDWAIVAQVPIHLLLTKADKLARGKAQDTVLKVRRELQGYTDFVTAQAFSAVSQYGLEEVHAKLREWFRSEAVRKNTHPGDH